MNFYRDALEACGSIIRESAPVQAGSPEIEVQARWHSGEFGDRFLSSDGRDVRIEDFGRWNREAGPDFIDARIRIAGRLTVGPIEIDLDPRDWETHGHALNPDFCETILHVHVTEPAERFFTRTMDHREVPQIRIAPLAQKCETSIPFITGDPALADRILTSAARHRFETKAASLRDRVAWRGVEDTLFENLAAGLGYKRNTIPMRLLAQRAGIREAADPANGEAILFGLAGFLESPEPAVHDESARDYLRSLWERWWDRRAAAARLILPRPAWIFAGNRPANHPHRRVAALAVLATRIPALTSAIHSGDRSGFIATLESISHPFWSHRFNLKGSPLARPQALVGRQRTLDLLLNVFHPLRAALGAEAWAGWSAEPAPAPGLVFRDLSERFFGESSPEFLRSVRHQQGLLQLERDFRHSDRADALIDALRKRSQGLDDRPREGMLRPPSRT